MSQRCQLRTRAAQQKSVFFDHLVSCHKQRLWDGETEDLGSLEIVDQLDSSRIRPEGQRAFRP